MPAVKVDFKNAYGSATFEGEVAPDGPTGYKFWGTLKAGMGLDRRSTSFKNTVALGSGGTSDEYTYLEFTLDGSGDTFPVNGSGTRLKDETVDFRLGINDGISGQYTYGDKVTSAVGGPWQSLKPTYTTKDSLGNVMYDVRFDGKARADGPTGYVITGTLNAAGGPGALTTQYCTFGYKNDGGSWQYVTYACDDTPSDFTITGNRKAGEGIRVVVGATAKVFNLYGYGNEVATALPDNF